MEHLGHRLKAAREAAGLTQSELAERVGMSQQGINDIENKGGRPRKLIEIARACGVSPEWLLGQSATKHDLAPPQQTASTFKQSQTQKLVPIGKALPEYDIRAGASYGGGRSDEEWQDGGVSAHQAVAHWGLPPAYVERELGLSYGHADVIKVRGDSMDDGTSAALVSGDRVIIDRKDTDPRQGGIFAVWDGEGVIIKQVEIVRGVDPPRIVCTSRNKNYNPIHLDLVGDVHIIGRVAVKMSRM
ncbi:XRE family transcriptional regulator [Methylobacterium oryzihabitans]|uniref:XRE family transcriptional regulator n=1 Tax=Methylobacterium oryzihabitans TaxID=2499852 RepID=A0A3S2YNG9_9HYPH|nr:XRE family transcriptional regulator [Methylobacterium oryzihabitans]RVU15217.1 XRE family transcriptional regulator [Methylobacterium oryzihabitans]